MHRRTALIWIGRALYSACAAVVAVPIARFLPFSGERSDAGSVRRRVARLDALPAGEPQMLPVFGTRQDAWTRYAEQVVGRVWVVRKSPETVPPAEAKLDVFNAACPHAGCPIQEVVSDGFLCRCHGAKFGLDGSRSPDAADYTNASPRGMDPLRYEIVRDDPAGPWWVEIDYRDYEAGLAERIERA